MKTLDEAKRTNGESRPMDDEETSLLIKLTFDELKTEGDSSELEGIVNDALACSVLLDKLKKHSPTTKPTPQLTAWLALLSRGNPGRATMWAFALHKRFHGQQVTLKEFIETVIPLGIPTEDFTKACWESQKKLGEKPDNLLDRSETWEAACQKT